MYLKRLFDKNDPAPPVSQSLPRLKITHATDVWRISPSHMLEGVMAGYMTLTRGRLILHGTVPGGTTRTAQDTVFTIRRVPGYWCCHCVRRCPNGPAAQRHVIDNHPGVVSPDRNNPHGYELLNAIECVRV